VVFKETIVWRGKNVLIHIKVEKQLSFLYMFVVRIIINYLLIGEKPGLVVRAEGSRPRGRGFESRRILDGCKRC
jgi:hypothetical protein